jgi:hypothetical protein
MLVLTMPNRPSSLDDERTNFNQNGAATKKTRSFATLASSLSSQSDSGLISAPGVSPVAEFVAESTVLD